MRCFAVLLLSLVLFVPWAASYGDPKNDYRLRLERSSDGHGNSVFALEIVDRSRAICDVKGNPVVNYLFVNRKTGKRRWLFPQTQRCIWRSLYFAKHPRSSPTGPTTAHAVVYDVTPSGDLAKDWMDGVRICTGTNPCLPLRRLFVSRADGSDITPLTPTFQILDSETGPARITQRTDGVIVVSFQDYPPRARAEFSVDTFKVLKTWQSPRW